MWMEQKPRHEFRENTYSEETGKKVNEQNKNILRGMKYYLLKNLSFWYIN